MQAMMVAGLMPRTPASAAPGAGVEGGAAAMTDGVDFSALLMAQLKGNVGLLPTATGEETEVGASLPISLDETLDLAGATPLDADVGFTFDPALQGLVSPSLSGQPAQPVVTGQGGELSVSLSAIRSEGEGRTVVLPGASDAALALAKDKVSSPGQDGVADFAVDGKSLPSGGEGMRAETMRPFSPEAFHMPESAPSPVPVMQAASHVGPAVDARGAAAVVQPPVGNPGWGDALGQKVVWMAGQQQQVAELRLNPPHLGPMEVRLTISNDQVSALFVSHQPAVRDAIEAAMPRLREMFADSGMMLGNAMVSSDSLPQQQHQASTREGESGAAPYSGFPSMVDGAPSLAGGILALPEGGRGLVDFFA